MQQPAYCKERKQKEEETLYKRIRIPVKCVYRNEEAGRSIVSHLMSVKGIKTASANPLTGKVLVIFNEDIVNEDSILRGIRQHLREKNSTGSVSNERRLIEQKFNTEAAQPISIEEAYPFEDSETNWHAMDGNTVVHKLGTNYDQGLSNEHAALLRKQHGYNVLTEKKRKSFAARFLENLNGFSSKLLVGVSVASFLLGQIPDAIAVLTIVFIETSVSTAQAYKAEKSIYSLKNMMVHKAKVLRGGREEIIESKLLVPGDVIKVEAGEKVPADARIIDCNDLRTTEASLTGESSTVIKDCEKCNRYTELALRSCMLYMGSSVVSGKGTAIVVATGMNTQIGKIASMLQNIHNEATPLQSRIEKFTNSITRVCIWGCLGLGVVGLAAGRSFVEMLTLGVSLSIGALPESLPAVVTVAMALSVQRMAKRNAIVRKLPAVETLGSANVICCDKTGTLTMNEMTVKKIYVDRSTYAVSGYGYAPAGEIILAEGDPTSKDALKQILKAGVLCNNALLENKGKKWSIQGDPTEGALIVAARKYDIDDIFLKESCKRIREIPFDSGRRHMTVIVEGEDGAYAYCKGSTSKIFEKCSSIYENGVERLFTATDREKLMGICNEMADNALRVLAFAYKKTHLENVDNNFTFLGLVGMEDPPREGIGNSIKKCQNAGIKVVMITGDNKNTAAAIGRQIGLLDGGLVVSGSELDNMSDEELQLKIRKIEVFARTSPEQKYKIVRAFKREGFVVAMTGDGVNDAPAIKEANIGIAMGGAGSDVAKDAADITLVDDNFDTIVSAIEEGRCVSNNIKSAMRYLLAGSLGEVIALTLTSGVTGILPLLSIQILWTNVICETLLGAPFATQNPDDSMMGQLPLKKNAPLVDRKLGLQIVKRGIGIGLSTFGVFEGAMLLGAGIQKARTLAFSNLILAQLVNVYDGKNSTRQLSNKYTTAASVSSVILLMGIIYVPFLNSIFGTVPLMLPDWALIGTGVAISRI